MSLFDFSSRDCYVLDGGLGAEIEKDYPDLLDDPLWSGRLLHSNPQMLEAIHLNFLRNGADIIITASYQTSVELLSQHLKLSEQEALALISESVNLAKRARSKFLSDTPAGALGPPLVAGSVGPYGACLHDSSEYRGDYVDRVSREQMKVWHRPRMAALLSAGVDLLAMETIPAQVEAEVLVDLLQEFPYAKAWISFSCKDDLHSCHGELFSEAVASVCRSPQVVAMGINCTHPRYIAPLLESAAGVTDKPFIVYPDGKDHWDTDSKCWVRSPRPLERGFPEEVLKLWRSLGARIIGGCCHVSPLNIRGIKDALTVDHGTTKL